MLKADVAGSAGPDRAYYRRALIELYEVYNPPKVQDVDDLLAKYKGYESELLRVATEKYIPPPASQLSTEQQHRHCIEQLSFEPTLPPISSTPRQSVWYRTELVHLFEHYDAANLDQVDHLLNKYAGHETGEPRHCF
jgi:hypothetical protein